MIDAKIKSLVFEKAYCYDHNFNFYQKALGEPFFEEGVIVYYDSKTEALFIPFFPLDNNFEDIEERVKNIIRNYNPLIIIYWGFINLGKMKIPNYKLKVDSYYDEYDVDATIEISNFSLEKNKNIFQEIKKAKENEITTEVKNIKKFEAEHLGIMKRFFYNHKDIDFFDTHLINSLKKILPLKKTKIIEARKKSLLVGFTILDASFPNFLIDLFGFYDKDHSRGISSLLYLNMIEYSKKIGYGYLNLGNTINKRLFDYKKKWNPLLSKPIDSNVWERKKGVYKNLIQKWSEERAESYKK